MVRFSREQVEELKNRSPVGSVIWEVCLAVQSTTALVEALRLAYAALCTHAGEEQKSIAWKAVDAALTAFEKDAG